ncbi:MAG: DUF1573 domain-containing protein [Planctomycetes bacterium]|nr:DUF1573 domain-containing protein [Planctomycetota bacterium]
MKTFLTIVVCSAVVGLGLGATLARMQIPPVPKPAVEPQADAPILQADKDAPKAEVPEATFEFGSMEMETSMSHDFIVRNVGASPLQLKVGDTTCKCTVGDLTNNEVEPGGQTEVRLEWIAKTAPGPFRHGATLHTNDPLQSHIQLTVEGQVIASTTVLTPSELIYGTLRTDETRMSDTTLVSYVDEKLEIVAHEISGKGFQSQVEVHFEPLEKDQLPMPEAQSGIKILTTYRAGKTIGPLRGFLTLSTNLENAEKINVPMSCHVVGDISIYGPGWNGRRGLLTLGKIRSPEGKKMRLNLAVRGEYAADTEFTVASVEPKELKVSFGERRKMKEQLVHVPLLIEVPAGTQPMVWLGKPASTDATIVLKTTHPETPEVQLRVRFAVGP